MKEIKLIVTDLDGTFLSHSETDGSLEKNICAMESGTGGRHSGISLHGPVHGCKAPPR